MKKVLAFSAKTIVVVFSLSLLIWLTKHSYSKEKEFGFVGELIRNLGDFPDMFSMAVEEVQKLPETFVLTPSNFKDINELNQDVKLLSAFTSKPKERTVQLFNLRDNQLLHSWIIPNPFQPHDRIMDPVLFSDSSLCYSFNGVSGITKIDKLGNVIWQQEDIIHHHSMQIDEDENIWACAYVREPNGHIFYKTTFQLGEKKLWCVDNVIIKLDHITGEILFVKSISEMLKENQLEHLILKTANIDDPFHINDIEPATYDSPYFKKGDVFISSRNLSSIIHYRPINNKVIQVISGPFYCQHDVDIINDSTLLFFNNNTFVNEAQNNWANPHSKEPIELDNFQSNIMSYSLNSNTFNMIQEDVFITNEIFTNTEGMVQQLNDSTYFVEEQNSGVLWVINNEKVVYKNVLPSQHEGYHHLPNWIKVIK